MVPGCIHLVMIFFLHDTPYWLIEKSNKLEARCVLTIEIVHSSTYVCRYVRYAE
jgi:hypothetical protein